MPPPKRRQEIAHALDVSLAELDGLAAALRRDLAGLAGSGSVDERLAVEIAADLAAAFSACSKVNPLPSSFLDPV